MACASGLDQVADGCWAFMQPDGSWGLNNAGLITDGDASLLVDTLFDARLTASMLTMMREAIPAARDIGTVVNTHANGDHCWGNQEVRGAEIIASRRSAEEMSEVPPALMAKLGKVARLAVALGPAGRGIGWLTRRLELEPIASVIEAAPYILDIFGDFHFEGIDLVLPTRTFDDQLSLKVGQKKVELIEVGPAHTKGDVIIHVPDDRVVYTGDILFIGGHPVMWEGPVQNWVDACRRIEAMDVDVIVPGHGPRTDKAGVAKVRHYLETLDAEAKKRFDAGMSVARAARDIDLSQFDDWGDAERVVVNVDTLFRGYAGGPPRKSVVPCFAAMARHCHKTLY